MPSNAGQASYGADPLGARRRGRPPGSKNKPKSITVAKDLKDSIGPYLATDDLVYLLNTLDGKEKPELTKDVDIFLALQLKALLPVLAQEIKGGQLSREATSRSGTVKELLAIRFQMEKAKAGNDGTDQRTFIQNIFVARGIDPTRINALIGTTELPHRDVPVSLPRSIDGDEQATDSSGELSDELPERLQQVQTGGEE